MDDLERRIRAARPISGHRDLPPSERADRELAALIHVDADVVLPIQSPLTRRRRSPRLMGLAAIITLIAIVGGAVSIATPYRAYGASPPILQIMETSRSSQDVLIELREELMGGPTDAVPPGSLEIYVEAWTLHTEEADVLGESLVAPEEYAIARGMDGSLTTTVTSGRAVDGDGKPVQEAGAPIEGSLIWQESWAPGKYEFLFPSPFPTETDEAEPYLRAATGSGDDVSTAGAIQAINDLLFEQQLRDDQQAALLGWLAERADLRLAGETVDRLGRPALVFTVTDPNQPEYERHLLISEGSGQILATETIYIGATREDIPSPSVVNYFAWK